MSEYSGPYEVWNMTRRYRLCDFETREQAVAFSDEMNKSPNATEYGLRYDWCRVNPRARTPRHFGLKDVSHG